MALLSQNISLRIEMERLERFKEKKLNLNLIQEEKDFVRKKNLTQQEKSAKMRSNLIQSEEEKENRDSQNIMESLSLKVIMLDWEFPWEMLDPSFILLTVSSLIVIFEYLLDDLVYLYSIILLSNFITANYHE